MHGTFPGCEILASAHGYDELIEALRSVKEIRELSNDFCDDVGGLTKGHTDKVLGPSRAKTLSPMTLNLFLELFAVDIVLVTNLDAAKRMEPRWERREAGHVRLKPARMSQKAIDRARPFVMAELGRRGAAARRRKQLEAQGCNHE